MSLAAGNEFRRHGAVYVHRDSREFSYSDGDAVEKYLKTVLESAEDLSSQSVELERAIQDWATEYHLSSKRANLLRGFELPRGRRVLELGCGCGAISRFLGEEGMEVDAVEGSPVRAELAALRCRDLDNVTVYCANFNELELPAGEYDLICLVGVAEYAARFMNADGEVKEPVLALLQRLKGALCAGGVIVVAIENRTGMKYVLGAHEDHYGKRFVGINNYFGVKDINTYTLPEWEEIFRELGVSSRKVYLPFPDYKLPTAILSRDFAAGNPDAFCNLEGLASRDYVDIFNPPVRESLLWQSAAANHSMDLYANSFLFVVSPAAGGVGSEYSFDFAQLPGFSRRREYCLVTVKPEGEDIVRRRRIVEGEPADLSVRQRVVDEPYRRGTLMSVLWSRALELEPETERFIRLVESYLDYVGGRDGVSIDLTPSNITVDEEGSYHAFDEEWTTETEPSKEFLLFRSLLILMSTADRSVRPYARLNRLETVRDFILHVAGRVGLDIAARLDGFVEQEESFQRCVAVDRTGNPTRELLDRPIMEDPKHTAPVKLRLYWRRMEEAYTEEASRHAWIENSDDKQTVTMMLPPGAVNAAWMRFNPCETVRDDGIGFMRIYRMEVTAVSPGAGERTRLWSMSTPEIVEYGRMSGIRYGASGLGSVFMVTRDDPAIELQFIPRCKVPGDHYLEFTVELRVPRSADYLLARDRYVTLQEKLEERLEGIDDLQAANARLTEEVSAIKTSNFWTMLTLYRAFRARTDALAEKLELWRSMLRNTGFRRTRRRAYEQGKRRLLELVGRRPENARPPTRYEAWRLRHLKRVAKSALDGPLISVVMPVHNASRPVLTKAIESVTSQLYGNWELCIADDASDNQETLDVLNGLDDARIKVTRLSENRNISAATNAAAALATGQYLAFMDNDDELPDEALEEVASVVVEQGADLVYTDEDFIRTDGRLDNPHFKPDYNPDLLLSHNYITHLLVLEKELFERIGRLRSEYDGAQDYDLVLRAVEQARRIVHIPKPLYHWRMSEGSTSVNPTIKPGGHRNARRALEDALRRRGIDGTVEETRLPHYFRVKRSIAGSPGISIVVPFKDKPQLLKKCMTSIVDRSTYSNFEILGISNDSTLSATYDEMEALKKLDGRISFRELNSDFNFSRLVNAGVTWSRGEHVLLLNNDIEIITPDWLEALLEHSQRPEVAAVGGKLYYPDNTIQHAGIAVGLGGYAGHLHSRFRADAPGYFNRLNVIQNVSAVTGAMMMFERSKFTAIGPFDEESFRIAYNDVDFCLRARESGYLNVFTPCAEAYHHESASRGYEDTLRKQERFAKEKENLLKRHGGVIAAGDPYYNPNFDRNRDDFRYFVQPGKVTVA